MPSSPSPSPPRDSSKTQEDSVNGSVTDSPTAAHDTLTLRALVTTKEAGIIIGKSGKNVADIRDQSGVKAGVSKVVPGVHERVLSVTGSVEAVAKAYTLIINQLLANAPPSSPSQTASNSGYSPSSTNTSVNLLISHNLMGTIIGRNGLKIKAIQDSSGARMVAEKEMLPQSTERIVVVQGTADSIGTAIEEIGKCLLEDWERGVGTVLFHPGTTEGRSHPARRSSNAYSSGNLSGVPRRNGDLSHQSSSYNQSNSTPPYNNNNNNSNNNNNNNNNTNSNSNNHRHHNNSPPSRHHHHHSHHHGHNSSSSLHRSSSPNGLTGVTSSSSPSSPQSGNLRTQNISIPSDMVGCIIGRGGTKITEIRRLSGSKISIAKTPHDETGERMFTIIGTSESNEKALFLLYNQLEMEKERRVGREGSTDVQD